MRRMLPRSTPLALFAAVPALLTACADFSAQISNHSQRPIYAAMFEQSPQTGLRLLASSPIAPDDHTTLGPAKPGSDDPADQVFLVVDTNPNPKSFRRIPLTKGTTRFEVIQLGRDPKAPIQVNKLP